MNKEFIQKLTILVEVNLANEKFGPEDLAKRYLFLPVESRGILPDKEDDFDGVITEFVIKDYFNF